LPTDNRMGYTSSMTMKREAKKQMTWAAKGEAQYIENPVRRGASRKAGKGDWETGADYIAGRRGGSTAEGEARGSKTVAQRITNRQKGYRG
jgi:hypothetical protein